MNNTEIKVLIDKINQYDTIILFRHIRPDPDALGSQLGFKYALEKYFPNKSIYAVGTLPNNLSFIGSMDEVETEQFNNALAIVLDTANAPRIDDDRYQNCKEIIKIDHHPPLDQYGVLNIVNTKASSTSEMIYEILLNLGFNNIEINQAIAKCLYIGIVGDTGRFLYNNTTEKTMKIASELLRYDIQHTEMINEMSERDIKSIRFQGYVMQNFEFESSVGFIYISKEILEKFEITSQEASLFVNAMADVKGIKAWAFAVEEQSEIRVRLRSKKTIINELAAKFNGGGHPLASGASVYSKEELNTLREALVNLVN